MKNENSLSQRMPLISVIVPIYNTGSLMKRCVDSLIAQTYGNLEIILVDDGSSDNSHDIINSYVQKDNRIKKVEHQTNLGLFQARISGVDASHGEYIAFVDSDDYITVDWFRTLVQHAVDTNSDMVVGEWCNDWNGKRKTYINLDPFRINDFDLRGDDVLNAYMENEGLCYSWHVVWNKLYRRPLWEACGPAFKEYSHEHGHMLMWEDIAFSAGFWTHAQHVTNVHGITYIYCKTDTSATVTNGSYDYNRKYIDDVYGAMSFFRSQLLDANAFDRHEKHYSRWCKNAVTLLYREIVSNSKLKQLEDHIRKTFEVYDEIPKFNDFFYSVITEVAPSFVPRENNKKQIADPYTHIVSFDVFDTLVARPFVEPIDLFFMLSNIVNEGRPAYIDFADIRIQAEISCRNRKRIESPSFEDITLDEIYSEIERVTVFSHTEVESLKKKEIELELRFCNARKSGKDLFDLAMFLGKTVVITSDMYLPRDVIEQILANCGYSGWDKLYISNETRKTKFSGNLFKQILADYDVSDAHSVLHFGDNWDTDVKVARKLGMQAEHLPRASDIFRGTNKKIYSGRIYRKVFVRNSRWDDDTMALCSYVSTRCMLGVIANRMFDNPFVSFNKATDFNVNPAYVGYAALGPHIMELAEWIEERAIANGVGTVHFVARDGYLVKRAFDKLNTSEVKSNYVRLSRRSLLLADVDSIEDLYSLNRKMHMQTCTPKKLVDYLAPIIPQEKYEIAQALVEQDSVLWNHSFVDATDFYTNLKFMIENLVDISMLTPYKEELRQYFSEMIKPGDYIFDVGYNGRPESALTNLLGYPVGSFYLHTNSDVAIVRQKNYGIHCECFYSRIPKITGVMREHLLMELGPTTIGYEKTNGRLTPVLDENDIDACSQFVTSIIHESAISFIDDMQATFGDLLKDMIWQTGMRSVFVDFFLHDSEELDRQFFSSLDFEDTLGEGESLSALEFWNRESKKKIYSLEELPPMSKEMVGMDPNGVYVKLYAKLNRILPKGTRNRKAIRRFVARFIH